MVLLIFNTVGYQCVCVCDLDI